jgi:Tfp pilus assembly protein PilF/peroxiredoxin
VTFEDVAARAGVLDHAAGMSAAFLDYDNDGRLDIYAGNMWSAPGLRVTAKSTFMPDAPAEVRALYHRHARGNSLFRNLGDGRFEDVSLAARVELGRWAWSSDALDFDSDGWDDLYVANGMLTRETGPSDLDGFFWRQVVARSPLARLTGTPYDDAWRALNQLLLRGSIAARQRNVFLRNDGKGGFDDVSGALGLDLDQDGRSFAVLDLDRDGDPDLALMAARQAPQLRLFRNDYEAGGARIAVRLQGTTGNRDAVGARVTVETDALRRTRVVHAGSGFLSQHSRELLIGLGASRRIAKLRVAWPSGAEQVFDDVPLGHRVVIQEGGTLRSEPFRPVPPLRAETGGPQAAAPLGATWLYEPVPAPDFSLPDLRSGETRSLAELRGRPALVLAWAVSSPPSVDALRSLAASQDALAAAGVGVLAVALDPASEAARVRAAVASTSVPVVHATRDLGRSLAILHRHLFMGRPDMPLPTAFLLDAQGRVARLYRQAAFASEAARDASRIEASADGRLSRAVPFAGTFYAPAGSRNYLAYGHELLDQDLNAAALAAFERAAQATPNSSTLYRLGTLLAKSGQPARARNALERALALKPDLAEASNDLGALLAQEGDLPAAIERFRAALAAAPDYPDALNNLGYALLSTGREHEAQPYYEKALALQPGFPEALNNLGLLYGRSGDLDRAESRFRDALARRADYAEAANNLALVLVARGDAAGAVSLLNTFLETHPAADGPHITLAKIHLSAGRKAEGIAVLERLVQRDPKNLQALEILRAVQ